MMSFKQIISTILLITCITATKEANAMRGFVDYAAILGTAVMTTASIVYCCTSPEDRVNKAQKIITIIEVDTLLSLFSANRDDEETRKLILASNYSEEKAEKKIFDLLKKLDSAESNLKLAIKDSEKTETHTRAHDLLKQTNDLKIKIESILFAVSPEEFLQLNPYCDQ